MIFVFVYFIIQEDLFPTNLDTYRIVKKDSGFNKIQTWD